MKRKIAGLVLFCLILFAAILAGYWDMLSAEKLKVVRDKASNAVGEIADIVRDDPEPSRTAAASDVDTAAPAPSSMQAAGESAGPEQPASTGAAPPSAPTGPTGPPAAAAGEAAGGTGSAAPEAGTSAADALPTFDILRVEPDGSTVLAGRAPPGSTVSLLDGTTPIGSEKANAAGDFVVVLDERLAVGDHQIKIEARLPDGRSVASAETAIVSIPEPGREAELLAMVEAPDAASRLISIPAAKPDAGGATAGQDEAIAALPSGEAPGDLMLPEAQKPGTGEGTAAGAAGPAFSAPLAPGAAAQATLLVEAVEIENDTVYVAGRATGSASVRVYIDNAFLAEDRRPAEDRFLVSARASLKTGDHTVRADALDAAGAVLARVEVPFFKPEGEAMAAVSPSEPRVGAASSAEEPAGAREPAVAAAPDASSPPAAASTTADASAQDVPAHDAASTAAEALAERMAAAEPSAAPPELDPATAAPVRADDPAPADVTSAAAPVAGSGSEGAPSSAPEDAAVDAGRFGAEPPGAIDSGAGIAITRQPALESARSRVIIRRGDTLWRISRETYGLGRRYTVIYLANGDQIRDPNRIYPGQVFRVPKDDAADAGASRVQ